MSTQGDLKQLYGAVLDLCRVEAGQTLAVLTEGGERTVDADAYIAAAEQRSAHGLQINLRKRVFAPGGAKRTSLSGNSGAIEILKRVDILIDTVGLLWSAEQKELQNAGTRILMSRETPDVVCRMFPTVDLRRRVEAGEEMLKQARTMRITSAAGTDVTYQLGQYPVITQYGYTDIPGRWDNLPGGFLYTGGSDGAVEGRVVIDVGDLILPFKRYIAAPITMRIAKGQVVDIEGRGLDAEILRSYMARWKDPRAYAVSHIGWGMDEKAQWDFLSTSPLASVSNGVDGRSFCGNVLFSTGPNAELGGMNNTGCHLDIPLRNCSLTLDTIPIVEAGGLVPTVLQPAIEGRA